MYCPLFPEPDGEKTLFAIRFGMLTVFVPLGLGTILAVLPGITAAVCATKLTGSQDVDDFLWWKKKQIDKRARKRVT